MREKNSHCDTGDTRSSDKKMTRENAHTGKKQSLPERIIFDRSPDKEAKDPLEAVRKSSGHFIKYLPSPHPSPHGRGESEGKMAQIIYGKFIR